jgi:pimeloyl-ACP methyl ester carboxylesterase
MSGQVEPSTQGRRRTAKERAAAIAPRLVTVPCLSGSGFHNIAYTEWGSPGADRVAICVHGLTRQGRDFDPLAAALVQRGYRVLCPDLAGRGRSDWLVNHEDYGMAQYASDMAMVLAHSGAYRGGTEIDWIGTSLGGLIGIHLAALPGSPIRRMVVNDIGPFLPWEALGRIGSYLKIMPKSFGNFYAAEAYFREVLAPFGRLGDSEWFHLTKHSIANNDDGRWRLLVDPGVARAFRTIPFFNVSLWQQWDAIHCPVLVLRGEHSDLLGRDVAVSMTRRGPRAHLVEFPECGHAPALMDHRQIGTVVHWLTQETVTPG